MTESTASIPAHFRNRQKPRAAEVIERKSCKSGYGEQRDVYQLITVSECRRILGDVSDSWIWRAINDPNINFPQPLYIRRRRFWRRVDVERFIDEQAGRTAE